MSTESLFRNAKILIRADGIIADIHLRNLLAKSGLHAAAALIGLFGAVMLGVAAFLALQREFGPIAAAGLVGGGALLLAVIISMIAARLKPGRDLKLAHELREASTEALLVDLKAMELEVLGFARGIRHPLDGALPGLIVPLAGMLLKMLRNRQAGPAEKP